MRPHTNSQYAASRYRHYYFLHSNSPLNENEHDVPTTSTQYAVIRPQNLFHVSYNFIIGFWRLLTSILRSYGGTPVFDIASAPNLAYCPSLNSQRHASFNR